MSNMCAVLRKFLTQMIRQKVKGINFKNTKEYLKSEYNDKGFRPHQAINAINVFRLHTTDYSSKWDFDSLKKTAVADI